MTAALRIENWQEKKKKERKLAGGEEARQEPTPPWDDKSCTVEGESGVTLDMT